MRGTRWRQAGIAAALLLVLCTACGREEAAPAGDAGTSTTQAGDGNVTISGDDSIAESLTWRVPDVVDDGARVDARTRADAALAAGDLYSSGASAIPLYLSVLEAAPDDAAARAGLRRATARVLEEGRVALAASGEDIDALRRAHVAASVARTALAEDEAVEAYLAEVDIADRLWELNRLAEEELREGRLGETGRGGALARVDEVLALEPGQPRALQTQAAIESAMIRRAEDAATAGDFEPARRWLDHAAKIRADAPTVADARARVTRMRLGRIARLRDEGIAALPKANGIEQARELLAQMLVIAEPGNGAVNELRERIDLAVHYGSFRPGQRFTDAVDGGARGPQMIVLPHGGFRMGAADADQRADDNERPQRYVRFDRGIAFSVREVTVAEFRRFTTATGHRTRAARRGYSMPYDERSGNFVRRSGVDWRSAYDGSRAGEDAPVLHVSAADAEAYAAWLSEESGHRYRLPSEAEFEYALRAGSTTRYPWGEADEPPPRAGNFTGGLDRSPGGRSWSNAFKGYGDGHWGAAPAGSYQPNPFGLHDIAGNVSEWVADCWHDGYRRAPADGAAWVNPGCRTKVIRGGSWASSPVQTRSSWRAPAPVDTTNARIGFRVAREL